MQFFPHWIKLEVYFLNKWDEIANIMKKKTGIESLKKLLLNCICRWENTHVRGQVMHVMSLPLVIRVFSWSSPALLYFRM